MVENSKFQITNIKQITITKIQNAKQGHDISLIRLINEGYRYSYYLF